MVKTPPSAPWRTSPSISKRMQKIKSSNTKLEQAMSLILREMRLGVLRQPKMFGKPDFRVRGKKLLIFCDSSFWHGRNLKSLLKSKSFVRNKKLWVKKLIANSKRDRIVTRTLRNQGWEVLRFWDSDILKHRNKVINKIRKTLST